MYLHSMKIGLLTLGNSLLSCHKAFICQRIPASKDDLVIEHIETLGSAPHSLSILYIFIAYSFAAFSIVSLSILLCLTKSLPCFLNSPRKRSAVEQPVVESIERGDNAFPFIQVYNLSFR